MAESAQNFVEIQENGEPTESLGEISPLLRQVLGATTIFYQAVGFTRPWVSYAVMEEGVCVGVCSYKGPPKNGRVEIAYFTFPEHQRRGVASRMAGKLVEMALRHDPTLIVAAQTQAKEGPSTKVLRNNNFAFTETIMHPKDGQVWEWQFTGVDSAKQA